MQNHLINVIHGMLLPNLKLHIQSQPVGQKKQIWSVCTERHVTARTAKRRIALQTEAFLKSVATVLLGTKSEQTEKSRREKRDTPLPVCLDVLMLPGKFHLH